MTLPTCLVAVLHSFAHGKSIGKASPQSTACQRLQAPARCQAHARAAPAPETPAHPAHGDAAGNTHTKRTCSSCTASYIPRRPRTPRVGVE